MDSLPLVDELILALNAARKGLRQLENQETEPVDPNLLQRVDQALDRFKTEHEQGIRQTQQAIKLVLTIQQGEISSILTNSPVPLEVAIVNYTIGDDWGGEDMVSIPQTDGTFTLAEGYLARATHLPDRVTELHRAVYRAGCNNHNTTEH